MRYGRSIAARKGPQASRTSYNECVTVPKLSFTLVVFCIVRSIFPVQEPERVDEAQWPENGDAWSDAENEAGMDCELLQAMAEEDEEINVFNEETFGMGESM